MTSEINPLLCQICKKIFEDPIFLPCHNTICQSHTNDFVKDGTDEFYCVICVDVKHQMPKTPFIRNKIVEDLVKLNIHLTNEAKLYHEELMTAKGELERLFDELQAKKKDCDNQNIEHFSGIKKEISLKVENAKGQLDALKNHLCDQVDKCQKEMEQELNDIKNSYLVSVLSEELLKETGKKQMDYFRDPNPDINKLKNFSSVLSNEINTLNDNLKNYEKERKKILNKCLFIPSDLEFNQIDNTIGILKIGVFIFISIF